MVNFKTSCILFASPSNINFCTCLTGRRRTKPNNVIKIWPVSLSYYWKQLMVRLTRKEKRFWRNYKAWYHYNITMPKRPRWELRRDDPELLPTMFHDWVTHAGRFATQFCVESRSQSPNISHLESKSLWKIANTPTPPNKKIQSSEEVPSFSYFIRILQNESSKARAPSIYEIASSFKKGSHHLAKSLTLIFSFQRNSAEDISWYSRGSFS